MFTLLLTNITQQLVMKTQLEKSTDRRSPLETVKGMLALLSLLAPSQEGPLDCHAPNTFWDIFTGECICLPGFQTTEDHNKSDGCWRCNETCHPLAICAFPGVCQCDGKFMGNGLTSCTSPIPHLLGASGKSFLRDGSVLLSFRYSSPKKFTPREMFCKFGAKIIKSTNFTDQDVICRIPRVPPGKYIFFISFDSFHWPEVGASITLDRIVNIDEINEAIPFLVAMTVIILVAVVVDYGKRLLFALPPPEEEPPDTLEIEETDE
jgi:hypothetical protein